MESSFYMFFSMWRCWLNSIFLLLILQPLVQMKMPLAIQGTVEGGIQLKMIRLERLFSLTPDKEHCLGLSYLPRLADLGKRESAAIFSGRAHKPTKGIMVFSDCWEHPLLSSSGGRNYSVRN